ncbi:MAG: hypothetical protein GSR80_001669 [Desulfurococcales archaeon]|nr:hypothetical protein [Desulfurococcales archaeon]
MPGKLRRLRRPPRIKVLEAAGALGDGRVILTSSQPGLVVARVVSSDASREYQVVVSRRGPSVLHVYSNDNGTVYRGYVGYPIIAVMMVAGILPRDSGVEDSLKGIPWRELNEKFKKYSLVEEYIRKSLGDGDAWRRIEDFREKVLRELARLTLYYDKGLIRGASTP